MTVLCVLMAVGVVCGIGAAIEQARRPKVEAHADDWNAEGNARVGSRW